MGRPSLEEEERHAFSVTVLRLGHRVVRDLRLTTHVSLTARALGADGIVLSGQYDPRVLDSLRKVSERWGGSFKVSYEKGWKRFLNQAKAEGAEVVHLTVYGQPIQEVIEAIRASKRSKVIVVGSEKVPGVVYKLADWNVAVSSQPHSECGSLAVFLDRLFEGKELLREFKGAKLKVLPQRHGKRLERAE